MPINKRKKNKYGKLPAKIAKVDPWKILCVDFIGLYKFNQKGSKPVQLWAVTMIDPVTGWYFHKSDVEHLISALQENYKLSTDWSGNFVVVSHSTGIMKTNSLTLTCQTISLLYSKNYSSTSNKTSVFTLHYNTLRPT